MRGLNYILSASTHVMTDEDVRRSIKTPAVLCLLLLSSPSFQSSLQKLKWNIELKKQNTSKLLSNQKKDLRKEMASKLLASGKGAKFLKTLLILKGYLSMNFIK